MFDKQCAQELSVAEMKRALLEGDEKVLNKLLYFTAPIPATRQNRATRLIRQYPSPGG